MAPGIKRGGKGAKMTELRLGDLVLAKVKGFPHWPARGGEIVRSMAPGIKRGAKGAKMTELRLGDLVLAKVKGFPHGPARFQMSEE